MDDSSIAERFGVATERTSWIASLLCGELLAEMDKARGARGNPGGRPRPQERRILSEREIADQLGIVHETVGNWVAKNRSDPEFSQPPESRQHF
jgi:hypothetical protein